MITDYFLKNFLSVVVQTKLRKVQRRNPATETYLALNAYQFATKVTKKNKEVKPKHAKHNKLLFISNTKCIYKKLR